MSEKFAALEKGEITVGEAKAFVGIGAVIIKSLDVEMTYNNIMGVVKEIAFIQDTECFKAQ